VAATGINHVSVHARDLDESVRFYTDLFGLEKLPTPEFGYPVQWLRLGDRQLHLFVRDTGPPAYHHLAIDVDDFEAVFRRAEEQGLFDQQGFHRRPRLLPDGSVQMYLRDPAGNLVEVDWPDASTLDPARFGDLEKVPGPPEASLYAQRAVPVPPARK
jgi:catechol 2,3-dioxygenase-like lactoylglutathione lyase family enzyme